MTLRKDAPLSLPDEIVAYYERGLEEARFQEAEGQLEYVRTQEIIQRYLPAPPAVVLDVGGGPGAYACWLAREGFDVHLVDPVPLHLEQARAASRRQSEAPVKSVTLGDARRLGRRDGCADAVLLLGPLYHLTQRSSRLLALAEAMRVLRPGGVLVAEAISRFASTLAGLVRGTLGDAYFSRMARQDLIDGQHRNPVGRRDCFTTAFFHHPDELRDEVLEVGFVMEEILAVEGAAVFLQDLSERWQDAGSRERILETVRRLEDDPSIVGITGHIMAIALKPEMAVPSKGSRAINPS